jgi:hypothetical protein
VLHGDKKKQQSHIGLLDGHTTSARRRQLSEISLFGIAAQELDIKIVIMYISPLFAPSVFTPSRVLINSETVRNGQGMSTEHNSKLGSAYQMVLPLLLGSAYYPRFPLPVYFHTNKKRLLLKGRT